LRKYSPALLPGNAKRARLQQLYHFIRDCPQKPEQQVNRHRALNSTRSNRPRTKNLPENQGNEKAEEQQKIEIIEQMNIQIRTLNSLRADQERTQRKHYHQHDKTAMTNSCNQTRYDDQQENRASSEPAPGGELGEGYNKDITDEKDEQNCQTPIRRPKARR